MIIDRHQALRPFTHTKYTIPVAVYWSSTFRTDREQKREKVTMILGQDIMLPHLTM